jgi:predicted SnoaL-like aldol condensation-catalyzing enzyme/quercetin dioxygenase-like cupin family protein
VRHLVVPFALLLALATGILLADAGLLDLVSLDTGTVSEATTANSDVVRRFYTAVNAALSTGDVAPLDHLVATNFVDHTPPPGTASDRAGLIRYLLTLHATEPDLWLTIVDLVGQGDRVAALVRVEGTSGTPVSGLPPFTGRIWSSIDLFRVASGQIVEHWADDTGRVNVEPLLAVTVPVEMPATKIVEAGRLTYPPGSVETYWASGPTILLVESGDLAIDHDRISTDDATIVRASSASHPLPPGESATLTQGDAIALGRRSLYRIRNDGATTAVAMTVWAGNPGGPRVASGGIDSGQSTPPPLATYEPLAGGILVVFSANRATVTISRIALAPGATLARHRVAEAELAVVESGSVALTANDGHAWEREAPNVLITPMPDSPLSAGAGVILDAGTTAAYRPADGEPVTILMIVIGPVAEL